MSGSGMRAPRASGGPRLIALGSPTGIRVRADARNTPTAVLRGSGRRHRWSRVIAEREHWRIDDEWWRTPISRDYHVVVLDDGTLLTLYLDRVTRCWHVQR